MRKCANSQFTIGDTIISECSNMYNVYTEFKTLMRIVTVNT